MLNVRHISFHHQIQNRYVEHLMSTQYNSPAHSVIGCWGDYELMYTGKTAVVSTVLEKKN
jgi:hypothetical protein